MSFDGSKDNDLGLTLYPGLQSPRYGNNELSADAEALQNAPTSDEEGGGGTHRALLGQGRTPVVKQSEICKSLEHVSESRTKDGSIRDATPTSEGQRCSGQPNDAVLKTVSNPPGNQASSPHHPSDATSVVSHLAISPSQEQQPLTAGRNPNFSGDRPAGSDEEEPIILNPMRGQRVKTQYSLTEIAFAAEDAIKDAAATSSKEHHAAKDREETAPIDQCMLGDRYHVVDRARSDACLKIGTSNGPDCTVEGLQEAVSGSIKARTPEVYPLDGNSGAMPGIEEVRGPNSNIDYCPSLKKGLAIVTNTASKNTKFGRLEKEPTSPIFDKFTSMQSTSTSSSEHCHSSSLPSSPSSHTFSLIDRHRPNYSSITSTTTSSGLQSTNSYDLIKSPRKHPECAITSISSPIVLQQASHVLEALSSNPLPEELPHSPVLRAATSRQPRRSLDITPDSSDSESSSSESTSDLSDSNTETDSPRSIETATKLAILKPIRASLAPRLHHSDITALIIDFIQKFAPSNNSHRTVNVPKVNPQAGSKLALLDSLNAIIPILLPLLPNPDLVSRLLNFIMTFPTQGASYQTRAASSSGLPRGMTPQAWSQTGGGQFQGQHHHSAPASQQYNPPTQLHQAMSPSGGMPYPTQLHHNQGPLQASAQNHVPSGTSFQHFSPHAGASNHASSPTMLSHQPATQGQHSAGPTAFQQPTPQTTPTISQQRTGSIKNDSRIQQSFHSQPEAQPGTDIGRIQHPLRALHDTIGKVRADVCLLSEDEFKMHKLLHVAQQAIGWSHERFEEQQKTIDAHNSTIESLNKDVKLQQKTIDARNSTIGSLKKDVSKYQFAAGKWGVNNPTFGLPQGVLLEKEVALLRKALQDQMAKTKNAEHHGSKWMEYAKTLEATAPRPTQNPTPPILTPPNRPATQAVNEALQPNNQAPPNPPATQVINETIQPNYQAPPNPPATQVVNEAIQPDYQVARSGNKATQHCNLPPQLGVAQPGDKATQPCNLPPQSGEQGAAIDLTKSPDLTHAQLAKGPVSAKDALGGKRKRDDEPYWWIEEHYENLVNGIRKESSDNTTINPSKRRKESGEGAQRPDVLPTWDTSMRRKYEIHRKSTESRLAYEKDQRDEAQKQADALKKAEEARAVQLRNEQSKNARKEETRIRREKKKEALKAQKEEEKKAAKKAAEEEKIKAKAEADRKAQEAIEAAQRANDRNEEDAEDDGLDALFEDSDDEAEDEDEDQAALARELEKAMMEQDEEDESSPEEEQEGAITTQENDGELIIDWGEPSPEEIAAKAQREADFDAYAATRRLPPPPPVEDESSEESEEE